MRRATVLSLVVAACACTPTKHAKILDANEANAVFARTPAPAATGRRLHVDTRRSRLEVIASDVVTGGHHLRFGRWSATVVRGNRQSPSEVNVEVDMTTTTIDVPGAERIVRYTLLEVDTYPRATLVGTMQPNAGGARGEQIVEGVAELHGRKRALRFTGTLIEEPPVYRFRTQFAVSRQAFDIRLHDGWDAFIEDDVRVVLDVVATEERVLVEEE